MGNSPGWAPDPSTLQPVQSGWDPDRSTISQTAPTEQNPVTGVLSGIGAGVFRGVQGVENLANKALPASAQLPALNPALTSENTTAEKVGGGLESIGEFITGDAALEGMGLADRLGLATQVAKIAQQSPRIARAIEIGMNAIRMGTVGGVQGGVQAAAAGQPIAKGAEAGAEGGAGGSIAGEAIVAPALSKAGEALEEVAPKFGNALLQANKVKNFKYGKNPGRVFIDEKITPRAFEDYSDVEKSIKEAGENISREALGLLSKSPNAATKVDVVAPTHQIIDQALHEVSQTSGLPDRDGLVKDLENLRSEFTENFDAKGNSTGPKGPMTPAQIVKLKRDIGRGTRWDPTRSPETQQILNNVRKQVYSYLDGKVDQLVPELKPLNERWANQIEAEHLIGPRVAQDQAIAYGRSSGIHRTVLGAGAISLANGLATGNTVETLGGATALLNEATRSPAARIALSRTASAAGKVAGKKAVGSAASKLAAAEGARLAEPVADDTEGDH
jgi:hypothetical protein